MLLTYFLSDFETVPVVPIITGITLVFTFHMLCLLLLLLLLVDLVIVTKMHVSYMRLIQDTRISKALGKNIFTWDKLNNNFGYCYYFISRKTSRKTNIPMV
jgi:hypothetical protein